MNDTGLKFIASTQDVSALAEDYLCGKEALAAFFTSHYARKGIIEDMAGRLEGKFNREQACRILSAQKTFAVVKDGKERLRQFVDRHGFIVATGQQPVLFGGPLYILYKGLTAARLAASAQEKLGVPVLPVFWNAGEDHDFAEVATVGLLDRQNRLVSLSLPEKGGLRQDSYQVNLGKEIESLLDDLFRILPDTEFRPWLYELLASGYFPGTNLGMAFSEYLARLFAEYGIFMVDSCHPDLKKCCRGLFEAELFDARSSIEAFSKSSRAVSDAGYHLQIKPSDSDTSLFLIRDGVRDKIRLGQEANEFVLKNTGAKLTSDELEKFLQESPESFSPGVLLRPLVEAQVFGTLCYVAGPGEIAYYAQMRGLYQLRGLEMPAIFPRLSGILLEDKIARILDKFAVDAGSLKKGADALARELLGKKGNPARILAESENLKSVIGAKMAAIGEVAGEIDPTLAGPVKSTGESLMDSLDRLEKKVTQAAKKRDEILVDQLKKAQVHLWPGGKPQERELAAVYYLARYERELLHFLWENIKIELK